MHVAISVATAHMQLWGWATYKQKIDLPSLVLQNTEVFEKKKKNTKSLGVRSEPNEPPDTWCEQEGKWLNCSDSRDNKSIFSSIKRKQQTPEENPGSTQTAKFVEANSLVTCFLLWAPDSARI